MTYLTDDLTYGMTEKIEIIKYQIAYTPIYNDENIYNILLHIIWYGISWGCVITFCQYSRLNELQVYGPVSTATFQKSVNFC